MKIHVIRIILIAIFGIGITACNQASLGPTNNTQDSSSSSVASNLVGEESQEIGEIACVEPRPEMCAQIYQPVCGVVDTGVRCVTTPCPSSTLKTFGNACTACGNSKVSSYTKGECPIENEKIGEEN
jgi:hypothetical protein